MNLHDHYFRSDCLQVPQLLTLRLLRFDNSLRKLRSRISFPSVLDLSAYDSAADDTPTMLELVAVTVSGRRDSAELSRLFYQY